MGWLSDIKNRKMCKKKRQNIKFCRFLLFRMALFCFPYVTCSVGPVAPVPVAPVAPVGPVGPRCPAGPCAPVGPAGPMLPRTRRVSVRIQPQHSRRQSFLSVSKKQLIIFVLCLLIFFRNKFCCEGNFCRRVSAPPPPRCSGRLFRILPACHSILPARCMV